jgi:cell division protein FtsB
LLLTAPVVLSIYLFFAGDSGFYQIWMRDQQIAHLQQEISKVRAENAKLEQAAVLLERDLSEIERIARENYGMIKQNESIYMVYPSPPTEVVAP